MNTQLMLLWDKLTIYCSQELWVFISGSCNRKGREGREERGGEKKIKNAHTDKPFILKLILKWDGWLCLFGWRPWIWLILLHFLAPCMPATWGAGGAWPCDVPTVLRHGSLPGASTWWPVLVWQQGMDSWVETHLKSMQPHSAAAPELCCQNKAPGYGSPFYANAVLLEVSAPAKSARNLTLCAALDTEIVRSFCLWLTDSRSEIINLKPFSGKVTGMLFAWTWQYI